MCSISKEAFKGIPTDDKIVSLLEIMISDFGSMNSRVKNIENNVHALISKNAQSERRIKLLEYKSIDQEARSSRRNNLIFRGFKEVVGNDDCVSIIQNFLSDDQLDMQDVTIQRAHRLGSLRVTLSPLIKMQKRFFSSSFHFRMLFQTTSLHVYVHVCIFCFLLICYVCILSMKIKFS